jgi:hypothetical protein
MKNLILEQIRKRADLEHGGDVNKAAEEYFRDHPEYWQEYVKENTVHVGAAVVVTKRDERC